jgi:SH3 domain-containing kinase-binding protein 1
VDTAALDVLRKDLEMLKANTVSRDDYSALQQDLQHMREDMDKMRSQFHKKILDLMKEVDEEKKIRLNMQVEMDRVKKLVAPDDESDNF